MSASVEIKPPLTGAFQLTQYQLHATPSAVSDASCFARAQSALQQLSNGVANLNTITCTSGSSCGPATESAESFNSIMAASFYDQQEQCHNQLTTTDYALHPFIFVAVTPPDGWKQVPLCVPGSSMYLPVSVATRVINVGKEPADAILPDDAVPPDAGTAALTPVVTKQAISANGCKFKIIHNSALPPATGPTAPTKLETCSQVDGSKTLEVTCAEKCSKNVLCSIMTNTSSTSYDLWRVYMVEAAGMSVTGHLYIDTPPMNCQLNNMQLLLNATSSVLYKTSCCACPTCLV